MGGGGGGGGGTLSLKMNTLISIDIPLVSIDNDQDQIIISDIDQEATSALDNVMVPPFHDQEVVMKELTLQPPELMPLRRSTREEKSILDDYIAFLKEHGDDIRMMGDDLINFHQAIESLTLKNRPMP